MHSQAPAVPSVAQPPAVADLDGPAIVAARLTRRFGRATAVENITLTVGRGTVFGFLGPNGAGKTTTIRLLLGLIAPSEGTLLVLGRPLPSGGLAVRRRTGVVLEQHGLYEGLTVRASLEFAGRAYGLGKTEAARRVADLGERLGLADGLSSRPQTLSRGMRQRMSIARALVGRPELLVLDEPTNGLDAQAAADLRALLVELVGQGTTVFLTTHLLAEAERLCDEVAVIKSGRLVATGTPADLRRAASVHRVRIEGPGVSATVATGAGGRLGRWTADGPDAVVIEVESLRAVPDVVAVLVGMGAAIHRVEPVGQTLEAAFLELVGDAGQQRPAVAPPQAVGR